MFTLLVAEGFDESVDNWKNTLSLRFALPQVQVLVIYFASLNVYSLHRIHH